MTAGVGGSPSNSSQLFQIVVQPLTTVYNRSQPFTTASHKEQRAPIRRRFFAGHEHPARRSHVRRIGAVKCDSVLAGRYLVADVKNN